MKLLTRSADNQSFSLPDISRVTPYTIEQCIVRLEHYSERNNRKGSNLKARPDKLQSNVYHFRLSRIFSPGDIHRANLSTRIQVSGTLTQIEPDRFTKVEAVVGVTRFFYLKVFGLIVPPMYFIVSGLGLENSSDIKICLAYSLIWGIVAASVVYALYLNARRWKMEFLDEVREVLHRVNGSIE